MIGQGKQEWGKEEGAALLTVLLLVAVISVLAMSALDKLTIATRLAGNMSAMDQSRAYAQAGELVAASRIASIAQASPGRTTLAGGWMGKPTPFPIDGGTATVTLRDAGNCFNLNSLVIGGGEGGYTARPAAIVQFEGLMVAIGIARPTARRISLAATDWIDSDTQPLPGGAEDESYDGYRTGNTLMADASELRAVAGVSPEVFSVLRPWVCALPDAELSPLNVNTLTEKQFPLLMMLLPGQLPDASARKLIAERPADGYSSMVDFWKLPALGGVTPAAEVLGQPQLRTTWFDLAIAIELGGIQFRQSSLLDSRMQIIKTVRRSFGGNS